MKGIVSKSLSVARLLTLVGVVIHPAALAGSPDSSEIPVTCLRDLENESIETREKASAALKSWAKASPDRLVSLITPQSTPEQRERLLLLAFEAFSTTTRGALGVSFGFAGFRQALAAEEVFEEGIPIDSTLTGFDSGRVLKGGDLLRSIGGVRVRTTQQCRVETVSYDPGQQVRLEIEREGRPMFVMVRLGRWNDLRDVQGGTQTLQAPILQAAWRSRVARMTSAPVSETGAIQPLPGALAWVEGDRLSSPSHDNASLLRDANLQVRADPQPRQMLPLLPGLNNDQYTLERADAPDMVATGGPRGKVKAPAIPSRNANRRGGADRDAMALLIQQWRLQLHDLDQRLELSRQGLRDPKMTPEQRAENLQLIDSLESQRAALEAQVAQFQDAIRPR